MGMGWMGGWGDGGWDDSFMFFADCYSGSFSSIPYVLSTGNMSHMPLVERDNDFHQDEFSILNR